MDASRLTSSSTAWRMRVARQQQRNGEGDLVLYAPPKPGVATAPRCIPGVPARSMAASMLEQLEKDSICKGERRDAPVPVRTTFTELELCYDLKDTTRRYAGGRDVRGLHSRGLPMRGCVTRLSGHAYAALRARWVGDVSQCVMLHRPARPFARYRRLHSPAPSRGPSRGCSPPSRRSLPLLPRCWAARRL